MQFKFSKMHGLGNDFVVINNLNGIINLSQKEIKYLADRKLGIGCDQLILVEAAQDSISDFYYRIYNADGSEAAQCGNGARCFAYFININGLSTANILHLQTSSGVIVSEIIANGIVQVNMGYPKFRPSEIPFVYPLQQLSYELDIIGEIFKFGVISMGNPHVIIILPSETALADNEKLVLIAKEFQCSSLFPKSVNVNFMVINNNQEILLRTYERGCGFTLACGTGACASTVYGIMLNQLAPEVKVIMPGGSLQIQWQQATEVIMTGNAVHIFDGEIIL